MSLVLTCIQGIQATPPPFLRKLFYTYLRKVATSKNVQERRFAACTITTDHQFTSYWFRSSSTESHDVVGLRYEKTRLREGLGATRKKRKWLTAAAAPAWCPHQATAELQRSNVWSYYYYYYYYSPIQHNEWMLLSKGT